MQTFTVRKKADKVVIIFPTNFIRTLQLTHFSRHDYVTTVTSLVYRHGLAGLSLASERLCRRIRHCTQRTKATHAGPNLENWSSCVQIDCVAEWFKALLLLRS